MPQFFRRPGLCRGWNLPFLKPVSIFSGTLYTFTTFWCAHHLANAGKTVQPPPYHHPLSPELRVFQRKFSIAIRQNKRQLKHFQAGESGFSGNGFLPSIDNRENALNRA